MGSGWMNTDLRDAVLEAFANNGYYRADDPLWIEVSTAFCWENVWPVVDHRGYLTGDVGTAGEDGMLVTEDWQGIISAFDAKRGGWEIDSESGIAKPPKSAWEEVSDE
jgi:hypothetical protein